MSPLCFSNWLKAIDEICYTELGYSYQGLPDMPYRNWYDDGMTPQDAFYELVDEALPGVEFDNVYFQEFATYTDADPGL